MNAERWRPERAGVVNVWRYLEETFEFHAGRLLLRGPNGSGKSMALELLFPFLLDANAQPSRLSSSTKSRGGLLERLLTGSEHSSRAGFLWAEFRLNDRGFTIGARLRASESTRRVSIDWFSTTLSVGASLQLLDANRAPLSRANLADALGENGTIHDSADSYRDAVRTTLFPGFTATQYDSMISALLALRREKISQDLNPGRLSEILTSSLPPLDEHDITEVAEGFEKLDRRKDNIVRLESDLDLVRRLASRGRTYARIVLAGLAADVRNAETRRDDVTRGEREAREALSAASEHLARLEDEHVHAEQTVRDRISEIDVLRAHEAYKQGAALEQLRQELRRLEAATARARDEVAVREADRADAEAGYDEAKTRLAEAETNEARARTEADASAAAVGAAGVVGEARDLHPDDAENLLDAWASNRDEQLAGMRAAARALAERIRDRAHWEQQVEADREALDARRDEVVAAQNRVEAARSSYAAAVSVWAASCVVLTDLPPLSDDPASVARIAGSRASELAAAVAVEQDRTVAAKTAFEAEREVLAEERAELVAGRTPEPEPPPWRTERRRPGAPLWRLVDFAQGRATADRDGIESALLASGLLDAWVSADGSVSLPDGASDVSLDPSSAPAIGPALADALVPVDDPRVPVDVTSRVLRTIALASDAASVQAQAVVGPDGTFKLGSLTGRGMLTSARFIGAAAQERRRAERIAVLDGQIAVIDTQVAGLERVTADLNRRSVVLEAELAAVPSGVELTEAINAADVAGALMGQADERLSGSRKSLDQAEAAVRVAQADLMRLSAAHSLPTSDEELDAYANAVVNFRRAVHVWLRRRREADGLARTLVDAEARKTKVEDDHARALERVADAERDERDVAARLHALNATVGSRYQEIVAQLERAEAERDSHQTRAAEIVNELRALEGTKGRLERAVEEAAELRAQADARREQVQSTFVSAIALGLGTDAELGVEVGRLDGVTAVLDAARSLAQDLSGASVDERSLDQAFTRLNDTLHETRQSLAGHVDLFFEQTEHRWWSLRAATDGIRRNLHQLRSSLEADLVAAREELRDSEQRLFDETLTGSVRQAVADRIRRCTSLVKEINEQLVAVKTAAAGVGVKLRWEVDPEQPDAVRSAKGLLLKDPADLSETERDALYAFFRARLDQVRADLDGSAGWETRLREVLDYRTWHRFALEVAHRDWQGFQSATTSRLQKLSTGERSMALHLPMLASITAYYGGADDSICPRLILLDELFAGVDTANRGQLFGMLVAWDLDAVLTSDHEWCAYKTLDGIAIHHLHPAEGDDPVTSTRFVWNGLRRVATPVA